MIELSVVSDGNSDLRAINPTVIKIIGCGGGGSNAVNTMITAGVRDVEFVALNTDLQALNVSKAQKKIAIGQKLTGGLGAGANPEVGENAAKEDMENISNIVQGADMVIITAGMGGGTGTGSAPVVASIAREAGALTIAVVTTPFGFEGPVRMKNAQDGLKKLRQNVDSLIVVPNEQIMKIVDKKVNFRQAFRLADDVLCQGVQGISEIITLTGDINLDFADVKSVMQNQGDAILGVGIGEGENRAVDAAQRAISNPLLEDRQIDGASNILINIVGSDDEDTMVTMDEVQDITNNIKASASKNVNIIFGVYAKPDFGDKISVTVIATGFNHDDKETAGTDTPASPANENVIGYGEFENVLRGSRRPEPKKVEPESRLSTISLPVQPHVAPEKTAAPVSRPKAEGMESISADEYAALTGAKRPVTNSLEEALKRSDSQSRQSGVKQPPAGFHYDKNNLEQPAVWAKMSRSINLTDDRK